MLGRVTTAIAFILASCFAPSEVKASNSYVLGEYDFQVSLSELVGEKTDFRFSEYFEQEETLNWHIYVPADYDPTDPSGLMVFINPLKSDYMPPKWKRVFDDHNMIYISATGAGNFVPVGRRMANSIFAVTIIQKLYVIDPNVKIISGFSGGARTSCIILENLPGVFNGALVMGGGLPWSESTETLKKTLGAGAYVFLTGTKDSAEQETRQTYWQYRNAGVDNIKLISVKNLGHDFAGEKELSEALEFLTGSLRPAD
ncbi:MAG: hypothetical protein HKN36_05565 [Hellea sp.]|nr:hypothetical protein [Hellea sp.]